MSDVNQPSGLRVYDTETGGGRARIDSEDAHRDLTPVTDGPCGEAVGSRIVSISEEGGEFESSKRGEAARIARSSRASRRILRIRFASLADPNLGSAS